MQPVGNINCIARFPGLPLHCCDIAPSLRLGHAPQEDGRWRFRGARLLILAIAPADHPELLFGSHFCFSALICVLWFGV